MSLARGAFLFFVFFILGIVGWGAGIPLLILVIITMMASILSLFLFFYTSSRFFLLLSVLVFSVCGGAFYYALWDSYHFEVYLPQYGVEGEIEGRIISSPRTFSWNQVFLIETVSEHIVSVRLNKWYQLSYGDEVVLYGVISPLDEKTQYLKRDKVVGLIANPAVVSVVPSDTFSLRGLLFGFRQRLVDIFHRTLSVNNAALASGILLGQESVSFSREFSDAMKGSGTTHLVALSGFNITILVSAIFVIVGFVLPRRIGIPLALVGIILFVLMTGAEASVVRAAIMGGLVVVAQIFSRIYNFMHAAVAAAWVMLVFNPSLIQYDAGFILSFVALFGIVSLGSVLAERLRVRGGLRSIFKQSFCETVGAQLMVIPILSLLFEQFSVVGVLSNVLILPLIPLTMAVAFVVGMAGLVGHIFAQLGSVILSPLLSLEVWIIEVFGNMPVIKVNMGWVGAVVYYALMVGVLVWIKRYRYGYVGA